MVHSFSVGMTTTGLIPRFALFGVPLGLTLSQLDNLTICFAKPSDSNEASGGGMTPSRGWDHLWELLWAEHLCRPSCCRVFSEGLTRVRLFLITPR
jgi:hypothetical protein